MLLTQTPDYLILLAHNIMKSFKKFFSELQESYNVPVISIEKNQVELNDPETVNEINKNLSIALAKDFSSVEDGLNSAKKVLSMYGIELPKIQHRVDKKGTISVEIGQYKSSGENIKDVSGPFQEKNEFHKFLFRYELKDGTYDAKAEVKLK